MNFVEGHPIRAPENQAYVADMAIQRDIMKLGELGFQLAFIFGGRFLRSHLFRLLAPSPVSES